MMMSEFIERTGFEPTGDEYMAIEEEYMGGSDDKDTFCKNWKKNGGVQRLMRMRARKIEQLESNVRVAEKESAYMKDERNKFRAEFHKAERKISVLEAENESLKAKLAELEDQLAEFKITEEQISAAKAMQVALSKITLVKF